MPVPQITITSAGFAAIVNAENTGTAPVKLTHVGLTAQHFNVDTVGATVPAESKRLTTFGGKAVAADTLHLNVRDDTADTYTLRGFGLYLQDGTLFAVYSQATPIMEKAAAATLLLATDIRFAKINATSIEVGDIDFVNPPATTTQPGVVRLSTDQEAAAGSDHATALTPRGLARYINGRFGDGAPSVFVKGLLGAATAALFRTSLELKSAALRDEGHGNGLNADFLDGAHGEFYLDWRNFTGLPSQFPPAPHTHTIAQVTGLVDALNGKASLAGDTFTGAVSIKDNSLRLSGWRGIATDGVVYFGTANSYLFKSDVHFTFRSEEGNFIANLSSGGTIWTSANFDPNTRLNKAGDTMNGSLTMGGNNRNIRMMDENRDLPAVEIGAGYGTPSDRHGWIINRNPGGALFIGARNLSCTLTLGSSAGLSTLTGALNLSGSLTTEGGINSNNNGVASRGASAAFNLFDRNFGDRYWSIYSSNTAIRWWLNGVGELMWLSSGGALNAVGGFDVGSSRKLKDIDGDLPYGLDEVRRVSTLIGRYKPAYSPDNSPRVFFDAEQLAKIMPELVNLKGAEFQGEKVATIKIDQTMPPAYRAISELADMVDRLFEEVAALKAGR